MCYAKTFISSFCLGVFIGADSKCPYGHELRRGAAKFGQASTVAARNFGLPEPSRKIQRHQGMTLLT